MRVAWCFPGQGSQFVGMGKELADRFTSARQVFERADKALGDSISALCFENTLATNGTRPNKRTVQAACKLFCSYMTIVTQARWTWNERVFILASLDPILHLEPTSDDVEPWELLLPPGKDTGIRRDKLRHLTDGIDALASRSAKMRQDFLQVLFQNSDVSGHLVRNCETAYISLEGARCAAKTTNNSAELFARAVRQSTKGRRRSRGA